MTGIAPAMLLLFLKVNDFPPARNADHWLDLRWFAQPRP
jgi:hypothetical protein